MAQVQATEKVVVNLGAGEIGGGRLPAFFTGWRQVRVDLDPETQPDLVATMTDLSAIADEAVDAVWASHCLEHVYAHEVPSCLAEINRILSPRGFLCLRVPDLQTVAGSIAEDRMHEVLYQSPRGPVTAHDVVFGFGADVARGRLMMSHRTGFTPTVLSDALKNSFDSFLVRRTQALELIAVARKGPWSSEHEPGDLLAALGI
jgi:hypothetical protein